MGWPFVESRTAAKTSSSSATSVNPIRRSQPASKQDAHYTGECDDHGNLGERRRKRTGEIILHKSGYGQPHRWHAAERCLLGESGGGEMKNLSFAAWRPIGGKRCARGILFTARKLLRSSAGGRSGQSGRRRSRWSALRCRRAESSTRCDSSAATRCRRSRHWCSRFGCW